MMATEALKRYSVEEYLAIDRASETKSEYFDGEIFAMAGASESHNLIVGNLLRRLNEAFDHRPCRAYPSDMRLGIPTGLYTYPDVMAVCGQRQFEGDKRDILLNPTVIFEVLSPSTEAYDRGRKSAHYRQIPSLQAYLLVSQDRKLIEQFARQQDGSWLLIEVREGEWVIPSVDITLRIEEIYQYVEFDDTES